VSDEIDQEGQELRERGLTEVIIDYFRAKKKERYQQRESNGEDRSSRNKMKIGH
jgi:hypothetical protein